jgi:hypothetical protein
MGGLGSGRGRVKDCLEERASIDIREFKRRGRLHPGAYFPWSWSRGGEPSGSIRVSGAFEAVTLIYSFQANGGEWKPVERRVPLSKTPCHLGGHRDWFVCRCGRRAARLFSGRPYFVCRGCVRLPYATQQEGRRDRALRKAQKIRRRLGANLDPSEPIYHKPKGMHWKTFERWQRKAATADTAFENSFSCFVMNFMRKYGR